MVHRAAPLLFWTLAASAAGAERPDDFVDLADVVPDIVVDARYAGYFNFIGEPVDGYEAPICLLTRQAAEALADVQAALRPDNFGLKVCACDRPARRTEP